MSRTSPYKNRSTPLAYLDHIATAFDCHPRTILRAVTGNPTEYWAPAHNPRLRIKDVCETFQTPEDVFFTLLTGEEKCVPPAEAADYLQVSVRTLRNTAMYIPIVVGKGFLRFSQSDLEIWDAKRKRAAYEKINRLF